MFFWWETLGIPSVTPSFRVEPPIFQSDITINRIQQGLPGHGSNEYEFVQTSENNLLVDDHYMNYKYPMEMNQNYPKKSWMLTPPQKW